MADYEGRHRKPQYTGRHRKPEYQGRHRLSPPAAAPASAARPVPVPVARPAPRPAPRPVSSPSPELSGGGPSPSLPSGGAGTLEAEFLTGIGLLILLMFSSSASFGDKMMAVMKRGTLVCVTFFILSLVSSSGPNAARVARAFGALVIIAIVLTSPVNQVITDFDNIIKNDWTGTASSGGSGAGSASSSNAGNGPLTNQQVQQEINSLPNIPSNVKQIITNEPFNNPIKQQMAQQYSITQGLINTAKGILKDLGF